MPVFAGTAAADRIIGSAEADQIYGLDGNDTLYGMAGADWLVGGLGNDTLVGGLGDDSYDVDSTGDLVVERAGEGIDYVRASISYVLGANVENLSLTGTADLIGYGNALDNSITGNAGNNVLNGGAGNDILAGGLGNDVYDVDSTGDKVFERADEGYDRVRATVSFTLSANVEELNLGGTADINGFGNALANTIIGNAGANVLNGGAGDDILIGRGGNDTYDVDLAGDRVIEAANEGHDRVRASVSYTLASNVEELDLTGTANINGTGNVLNNVIIGNSGANSLHGLGGDDQIISGSAGSSLDGGDGNDTLLGGTGADGLRGAAGMDVLRGGGGDDTLVIGGTDLSTGQSLDGHLDLTAGDVFDGGAGRDTLSVFTNAGSGSLDLSVAELTGLEVLRAYSDTALLTALQINQFLEIDANSISIKGSGTVDLSRATLDVLVLNLSDNGNALILPSVGLSSPLVQGGAAADTVSGGTLSNEIHGNDGNDDLRGDAGADRLLGDAGDDRLTGGVGDDILEGGAGNDVLIGDVGVDTMHGGVGNDSYYVDSTNDVVFESTGEGIDQIISSVDYTLPDNVETLTLTGMFFSSLVGTGNDLDNTMIGFDGQATLIGGAGNDTYIVKYFDTNIVETAAGGIDTVKAEDNFTLGANVENLILMKALFGTGNELDNIIVGSSGSDFILGEAGSDIIHGGDGADYLTGGSGVDRVYGEDGNDIIEVLAGDQLIQEYYSGGAGVDELRLTADVLGGDSTIDIAGMAMSGFERLDSLVWNVYLSSSQLHLFSEVSVPAVHFVDGGNIDVTGVTFTSRGHFYLSDQATVFTVRAGDVDGGAGNDVIAVTRGYDPGTIEVLRGNDGNDHIIGGAFSDELYGGSGDDVIDGGAGDDTLYGGDGRDNLRGNAGSDFLYTSVAELQDGEIFNGGSGGDRLTITASTATDVIDLSRYSIIDIEALYSGVSKTIVSAGLLDSFREVAADIIQIKDAGSIDFSDSYEWAIGFNKMLLSDFGNTVNLSHLTGQAWNSSFAVFGGAGADMVLGADIGSELYGGGGADILRGGARSDYLQGDAGDDQLTGGTGDDVLTGGLGADEFKYTGTDSGIDRITDFRHSDGDSFVLLGMLHGSFSYLGASAFTSAGHTEARFAAGQVLIDTDGNGTADITINLTGVTSASQLQASDFVFA